MKKSNSTNYIILHKIRRKKLAAIVLFNFLLFTSCNNQAENILVVDKSVMINKLNDTIICKTELGSGYIDYFIDTLPPDSSLNIKKCCSGVIFIEIYKKNDPNNIYIKFNPSGPHKYKLNPYDCNNWETISRYYISEKDGEVITYKIIEKYSFYLTEENVINE